MQKYSGGIRHFIENSQVSRTTSVSKEIDKFFDGVFAPVRPEPGHAIHLFHDGDWHNYVFDGVQYNEEPWSDDEDVD